MLISTFTNHTMLFAIGTKVQFRYTGEKGIVTAVLGEDMLQVRLLKDPDFEIPAFEEDLIRDADLEPSSPGAKFVQMPSGKKAEAPARRTMKVQYMILKPKGIQLAFEPMPGRDGTVTRYKAWLINDTAHEFLIEFDLYTTEKDVLTVDDKITATSALELGDMLYDHLNEQPEAWLSLRRITTAGLDLPLEKVLKIKPKQFFNNFQTAPILAVQAYQFLMMEQFEPLPAKGDKGDSLKDYTKQAMRGRRASHGTSNSSPFRNLFDVTGYAEFLPEIDLHAETLLPAHLKKDKGEILRLQMVHFQRFLDKAVQLGVPRVFVIHGVGEGKLRNAIATLLQEHPHVLRFKNEYHHKYGYGATEVILE